MVKKGKHEYIKLHARVTVENYQRLDKIKEKFGFRSIYQIMNYLAYCFLRVADKEHDTIDEPVPDEIEEMFADYSDPVLPTKYKKAVSHKRPDEQ